MSAVDAGGFLEHGVSLSKSLLWKAQIAFYQQMGIDSWAKKIVPNYITTNPYVAEAVAQCIVANLVDAKLQSARGGTGLDPDEKAYVIELGTGAGRLGFYILKALDRMMADGNGRVPMLGREPKICFVMTDVAMENLDFIMAHERLQGYFEDGRLDCALLDASSPPEELRLLRSGKVIRRGSLRNPMLCVAHYVLCAIEQDAFRVYKDGTVRESLVSLTSPQREVLEPIDPELIARVRVNYQPGAPLDADERYSGDPALAGVLKDYSELMKGSTYEDTSLLVPVAAVRCMAYLRSLMAPGVRCAVLSSDKAYNDFEEFNGVEGYSRSTEGSLSFMANHDALKRWCRHSGGGAITSSSKAATMGDACLSSALLIPQLGGAPGDALEDLDCLNAAFNKFFSRYGAADHYNMAHIITIVDVGTALPPVDAAARSDDADEQAAGDGDIAEERGAHEGGGADDDDDDDDEDDDDDGEPSVAACIRRADTCGFTLQQVVAMLRHGLWDPWMFWLCKARIMHLTPHVSHEEQDMIMEVLEKVYDMWYHIGEEEDIAFELGRIAYSLNKRFYARALEWYELSVRVFGDHHITHFNIALAQHYLGQLDAAIASCEKSVSNNPGYETAIEYLADLRKEKLERDVVQ